MVMFADDLVICEHSRAEVFLQPERWRETFESHGLRIREENQSTCHAQKETKLSTFTKKVKTLKTFKYLGSMFDANGGAEKDVTNRVKIAWSKWRETTGVMYDRNIPTKLKDKAIIMAGMAVVLRGWLPHRGKAQMACNYCFPTRTMF